MDLGLKDKVALVTGASKGIGKAIAAELAKEGAHVSICARDARGLAAAAEELGRHGVRVLATPADVTRVEDCERVVAATAERYGRIDVLVNNAGSGALGRTVESATDEIWQQTIAMNLQSAIRFTRAATPVMRKGGGGRIVNISTAWARTPTGPSMVDYATTKGAMLAFSRAAAIELAADGILVNAVCPGFVRSPLHESLLDSAVDLMGFPSREAVVEFMKQQTLLKRIGAPEEVAAVVAFLVSARASYVTGSIYDVDGGYTKSVI